MTPTLQASHAQRISFERVAGYALVALVILYALVGLYSDTLADRVIKLAPALCTLAGVLATTMGASWFRGHMDERLVQGGDHD